MAKKIDQAAQGKNPKGGKPQAMDNLNVLSMEEYARRIAQTYDPDEEDELDASDYLEMAEDAEMRKQAIGYAQKALELEPDNLDAAALLAELTSRDEIEHLGKLTRLIEKGNALMEREGYFKEKGHFWLIFETRPYMHLRYTYMRLLIDCRMLRRAVKEGKELLELCPNDNLGVRFALIHLYAALEDEQGALELVKSNELNERDGQMMLALAVLYFKLGDFEQSRGYLKKLMEINPDTKRFVSAVADLDEETLQGALDPNGYRPRTIEELVSELADNEFLFGDIFPPFFCWAQRALKGIRVKKTTKK